MAERSRQTILNLSAKKIAQICRNVMLQELSVAEESTALSAALKRAVGNLPVTSPPPAIPDEVVNDEPELVPEFAHLSIKDIQAIPITDRVMQSQAAEFLKAPTDNLDIKFDEPGDFNTIAQVIHLAHDALQGGLYWNKHHENWFARQFIPDSAAYKAFRPAFDNISATNECHNTLCKFDSFERMTTFILTHFNIKFQDSFNTRLRLAMERLSINHNDKKSPQNCEELIDHAERIYSLHCKG